MCLNIATAHYNSYKQHRPMLATQNYMVVKELAVRQDSEGKHHFFSPFRFTPYEFGERYTASFGFGTVRRSSFVTHSREYVAVYSDIINEGLHANRTSAVPYISTSLFYNKSSIKLSGSRPQRCFFWAIIPRGAKVYYGTRGDVVSTELVVFKSKRAMLKWCEENP